MKETFDRFVERTKPEDIPSAFAEWMKQEFGWNGTFTKLEEKK